jgi:glycosyltransferase involved in cell wall biosynthesis
MKIALVSSSSGSRGGGEFYFRMLSSGLKSLGHDVQMWLSDESHMDEFAETMSETCPVRRFPYVNTYQRRLRVFGALWDRSAAQSICSLLNVEHFDIVHLNKQNLEDGLDLLKGISNCRHPAVATIHVTRSMTSLKAVGGRLRDWVTVRALKRCNLPLLGTSSVCTEDLKGFLSSETNPPVFNVPNGAFSVSPGNRTKHRASWSLPAEAVVLGTVARIEAQKNPLFVPRLLCHLPNHVHFVWVGDGSLRDELVAEANRLTVSERLHLNGWCHDGRDRISGFDIFILPSLYEGFPFATLESKSAAVPAVVSDVDGTRDAIDHGIDGFVCPLNDVDAWVKTLLPLVHSPELRAKTGAAALQRYNAEFSIEAMTKRTVAVYEDVIRRG